MTTSDRETPLVFIGREAEIQQLGETLNAAIREGQPKFVLLEGDVGVGKTEFMPHFLTVAWRSRNMEARTKRHFASQLNRRGDRQKAIGLLREAFAALNDLHLKEEADEVGALLVELESGRVA